MKEWVKEEGGWDRRKGMDSMDGRKGKQGRKGTRERVGGVRIWNRKGRNRKEGMKEVGRKR